MYGPVTGVKYCKICVFFNTISVYCGKICVMCSNVEFITIITRITKIHTFCFYNNKYKFIIKYTHFIKTNTNPVIGLKCDLFLGLVEPQRNLFKRSQR